LEPGHEFRFKRAGEGTRLRFLREVTPFEFKYVAVSVDKSKLGDPLVKSKGSIYRWVFGMVAEKIAESYDQIELTIDRCGGQEFQDYLEEYLHRIVASGGSTCNLVINDSNQNSLLQLADMICGAISRSLSGTTDADRYRTIIKHHELEVGMR